jgi:hypothetical protein
MLDEDLHICCLGVCREKMFLSQFVTFRLHRADFADQRLDTSDEDNQ